MKIESRAAGLCVFCRCVGGGDEGEMGKRGEEGRNGREGWKGGPEEGGG